jgi:hypothetical protein
MTIKYITDKVGNTTDVMIPIEEWNELLLNNAALNESLKEENEIEISKWQQDIVLNRIANAKPENYNNWEDVKKRIRY